MDSLVGLLGIACLFNSDSAKCIANSLRIRKFPYFYTSIAKQSVKNPCVVTEGSDLCEIRSSLLSDKAFIEASARNACAMRRQWQLMRINETDL